MGVDIESEKRYRVEIKKKTLSCDWRDKVLINFYSSFCYALELKV